MMGSLIFSKQHCLFLKHLEAGFCIDLLNLLPTLFRHFLQEAFCVQSHNQQDAKPQTVARGANASRGNFSFIMFTNLQLE